MKKELIVHRKPKSPNSEIFRTLRTNIQFMNQNNNLKSLLVTSTLPGEGKSWVASNLAVTFAQAGKKCIMIDADMRKGRLYTIFGISSKPGLSNYLSETRINEKGKTLNSAVDYIQETEIENLYVIAAGNVPPNPSELLVSQQMIGLIDELKEIFDIIIIDGTPCELVTDSVILSRIVDSCIIVAGYKITKKETLNSVIKNIKSVGGNLIGVVLNKVPISKKQSKYYYYGENKKNKNQNQFNKVNVDSLYNKYNESSEKNNETENRKIKIQTMSEDIPIRKTNTKTTSNTKKSTNINSNINTDKKANINKKITEQYKDSPEEFIKRSNKIIQQINRYIESEKK